MDILKSKLEELIKQYKNELQELIDLKNSMLYDESFDRAIEIQLEKTIEDLENLIKW